MNSKQHHAILTCALLFAGAPNAHASELRHAGAHIHGVNFAQIVLENKILEISYQMVAEQLDREGDSDGSNESKKHEHKEHEHSHERSSDDDTNGRAAAVAALQDASRLFSLPAAANCAQTAFTGELKGYNDNPSNTGNDEAHQGHQDALLMYQFSCENPEAFNTLSFAPAFATYPDLLQIETDALILDRAVSVTLTQSAADIKL